MTVPKAWVRRRPDKVLLVLSTLFVASLPTVSRSDEPAADPFTASEMDLFKLDTMLNAPVVTASGVEEEKALAPASVFVVTREEIDAHGYHSLAEILADVPGLYIVDDGVIPSVGVRGITGGLRAGSRIVKVMIDAVVVNFRPDLTAFLGPEFIPMDVVERVEIAKGPLSAVYGANAFIATVNVITRRPDNGLSAGVAGRATIVRSSGGYGAHGFMSYGDANKGILAAFSYDRIDRSGAQLQHTFARQSNHDSGVFEQLDPALFQRTTSGDVAGPASVFLQVRGSNAKVGSFTFEGGYQRLDSVGNFQPTSWLNPNTRIVLENLWTNLRWERRWTTVGVTASLGYSRGRPNRDENLYVTQNDSYRFKRHFGYDAVNGLASVEYSPLGDRLSLKAGIDFEYSNERVLYYTQFYNQALGPHAAGDRVDLIAPTDPKNMNTYDVGAFLQVTSTPSRRLPGLHLTGNFRIDKIEYGPVSFPINYSWRAAIAYRWNPSVVTRLVGGHAFQTPSGTLLSGHLGYGATSNVLGTIAGGLKTVQPQTVDSVEAIVSAQFLRHVALEVGVYFQDVQDRISFTQNSNFTFVPANAGERKSVGAEASLRLSFGRFLPYVVGAVDYGVGNSKPERDPPEQYPNWYVRAGIDVTVPEARFRVNAQVRGVGDRGATQSNVFQNSLVVYTLPAYADIDVTLSSMKLYPFGADRELRVVVGARNLIGLQRSEPGFSGADIPFFGRTFFFELRQYL